MFTHRIYYVWLRNFTVYLTHIKASLVTNVGEPLFYLFAMGYGLGSFIPTIEGMGYIDYIAPGIVVTSVMYSAVFECTFGSFTRMTVQRTYESIISTPITVEELALGEILWGTTKGLISASIVLIVMAVTGVYSPGLSIAPLLVVVLVTGFIFAAAALSFSALAPTYEFFNYFFTLCVAPMFFLSGVFFPVDRLPAMVKFVSEILPATHAVTLARSLFHGSWPVGGWYPAFFLVITGVILGSVAIRLVKRRIIR